MKLKNDIVQTIIIYLLSILLSIVALLIANLYIFDDFKTNEIQYEQIVHYNINIIDENGKNINEEIEKKYYIEKNQYDQIMKYELSGMVIMIIGGLLIVIADVHRKVKLFTDIVYKSVEGIESTKIIDETSEYIEINKIINNVNSLILRLKTKDRIKDELYENMIHDFKTPLHIISGNLELRHHGITLDYAVVEKQVERLKYYCEMNLIREEMDLSYFSGIELDEYINQIAKVYSSVNFIVDINERINFITKKESLYRIIDNIVANAYKHGKPNIIVIGLNEKENQYSLEIKNDGAEIDQEAINHVFKRGKSKTSTGLGLNIVSEIISDLGYNLEITSTKRETSFEIIIPKSKTAMELTE